jgi:hypothetical protein
LSWIPMVSVLDRFRTGVGADLARRSGLPR